MSDSKKAISKTRGILAGTSVGILLIPLSLAHPFGNPRGAKSPQGPLLAGARMSDPLRELVARKCGNCHSENVEWPIYSRVPPISWLLEHDVSDARAHMNLSRWNTYSKQERLDRLSEFAAEIRSGEMPPARYTAIHRDSVLTQGEQEALYDWTRAERRRLREEGQETEEAK
jgi:hypothetical protein